MERLLRGRINDEHEKAAGVLLVCAVVLPATFIAFVAGRLLLSFSVPPLSVIGTLAFIYLVSTTLALRGLIGSARASSPRSGRRASRSRGKGSL